jgi:hypothetical protein
MEVPLLTWQIGYSPFIFGIEFQWHDQFEKRKLLRKLIFKIENVGTKLNLGENP